MVVVEFCIGRICTYVPLSAVPHLHAGERILTTEYRRAICTLATKANFKFACDEFNRSYHREKDACLSMTTLRNDVIHEGIRLIQAKQKYLEGLLSSYGFDPVTCKYQEDNIPASLQNQTPEWVEVSTTVDIHSPPMDEWDPQNPSQEIPDNYLFVKEPIASKSKSNPSETLEEDVKDTEILEQDLSQTDEDPEPKQENGKDQNARDSDNKSNEQKQEYSCPDNDTTKYIPKRRGSRVEQPPEKKQSVIDDYVKWRNENVKSEISKIRYLWKVEKDSSEVVYISIDAVLVPMQSASHIKGGKSYKETSKENVVHWNIKVEWDDKSYAITGTRESVYPQLVAFLVESRLCKRFMMFFTDGETCIFDDIKSYFFYWNYVIYIDYHHVEKKVHELLSMSIIPKRVGDPREEPEYYVKGKKKGQIKKQVQVSLSVLYARVITSALFAGNWKEAILYLSNIDPAHVKNPDRLNELIKYIWRKRHYITCYAIRRKCGVRNSSNGAESLNNQCVSERQKGERRNWQSKGSASLAALAVCILNGESKRWFDQEEFKFHIRSPDDDA